MYFVNKPGTEVLLLDIRAHQPDIFVTGGCFCLLEGAFNAISDEGKHLSRLFWNSMREYKTRHCTERALAAPSIRPLCIVVRSSGEILL